MDVPKLRLYEQPANPHALSTDMIVAQTTCILGQPARLVRGRALYISPDETLYIGRGSEVFSSTDQGLTWILDCLIPVPSWKRAVTNWQLASRLLRWYIQAFRVLPSGARIAVARDGIYRAEAGGKEMSRVFKIERGSRPLNFAVDGQRILFGEYGEDMAESEVLIYVSEDGGRSFHEGFRFPRADILHIHNVIVDPYHDHYWVLVGDVGRQTGIGVLSKDLKNLDWVGRGTQRHRAVAAFVEPDGLIYGSDSDRDHNYILHLDRKTGRIDELKQVEGSSLFAAQFGMLRVISTCVEPNPYCQSRELSLYGSEDGQDWDRLVVHRKDRFSPLYFQFGTLVLPYTSATSSLLMYSGQATEGIDGIVAVTQVPQLRQRRLLVG